MTTLLAQYTWDARTNQYVEASGRFVSRARVKAALDDVIRAASSEIEDIARSYQAGEIGQSEWFLETAKRVKVINVASAAVAAGGTHALTPSVLGTVAARIKAQYQFLRDFAREIENGLPLDGNFLARAALYGQSGRPTFEAFARKADLAAGYAYERRLLHSSEHCRQCVQQAAMGWQPAGVLLPIGQCTCLNNCHCTFQRSMVNPEATATPRASRRVGARPKSPRPSATFADAQGTPNTGRIDMTTVTFAKGSKGGGLVGAVINAVAGAAGDGGCGNGTSNGKRGFQKGNQCGHKANRNPAVSAASKAHTSALGAAKKHLKAGTAASPAGRKAIQTAAKAGRVLQQARADHKAANVQAKSIKGKETRALASERALPLSAKPADGSTIHTKASAALESAHAKATAPPKPSKPPEASPQGKAATAAKEVGAIKTSMAADHLKDVHARAEAGTHDEAAVHKHIDKIARGTTKAELFAAAKAHGANTEGIKTKGQLVEHLKARTTNAIKPPTPKAPEAKASVPATLDPGTKGDRQILATAKREIRKQATYDEFGTARTVPVHLLRDRVEATHGAVDPARFDRVLKADRTKGKLDLIAVSDHRRFTRTQLDRSIPGVNETLGYVTPKDRPKRKGGKS